MILFPYRAQIKLHRWPVMTIAVSLLCLAVYLAQYRNELSIEAHAKAVCTELETASAHGAAAEGYRWGRHLVTCEEAVQHIQHSPDPQKHLAWHTGDLVKQGDARAADRLREQYRAFAARAPALLTARLWHDRSRLDPLGMLTSSFAHGDWEHVIINLFFFVAFAAGVELVLGPVLFLAMIVALAFGIGVFDYVISRWEDNLSPSLGLSGVVMGMLTLFTYFLPRARIRFFFWFLLAVGTFGMPAWFVATWFIGWDLLRQLNQVESSTNFVAHLAGAAFGLLLALALFRHKRHWAKGIIEERVDFTQDETWATRLNAIAASGAWLWVMFLATSVLAALIVKIVTAAGFRLLLLAPLLACWYYLYRLKHADPSGFSAYRLGVQALERQNYEEALKYLSPLAAANYPRALLALAQLRVSAPGGFRNEPEAILLYRRAAERGLAEAQHRLGMHYADGRGVEKDLAKAAEWYRLAAEQGLPEAAVSLAHLHENATGALRNPQQAIVWYGRAVELFRQRGLREDANAMLRHLESLGARGPSAQDVLARLRPLVKGSRR
jgi:membrane associated rhomboid family serine protease